MSDQETPEQSSSVLDEAELQRMTEGVAFLAATPEGRVETFEKDEEFYGWARAHAQTVEVLLAGAEMARRELEGGIDDVRSRREHDALRARRDLERLAEETGAAISYAFEPGSKDLIRSATLDWPYQHAPPTQPPYPAPRIGQGARFYDTAGCRDPARRVCFSSSNDLGFGARSVIAMEDVMLYPQAGWRGSPPMFVGGNGACTLLPVPMRSVRMA